MRGVSFCAVCHTKFKHANGLELSCRVLCNPYSYQTLPFDLVVAMSRQFDKQSSVERKVSVLLQPPAQIKFGHGQQTLKAPGRHVAPAAGSLWNPQRELEEVYSNKNSPRGKEEILFPITGARWRWGKMGRDGERWGKMGMGSFPALTLPQALSCREVACHLATQLEPRWHISKSFFFGGAMLDLKKVNRCPQCLQYQVVADKNGSFLLLRH